MADDDWSQYERLVLHRLGELEQTAREQHIAFEALNLELATLKTSVTVKTSLIAFLLSLAVTLAPLAIR